MRKILFILLLISSGLNAQTFSFQCICDYLTAADANCDICNTNIQSRLFKGILIRKDGTAFKWIDQPYIVQFQGNNATFKELIPNGETITITLAGTPFDSIPQYQDSIKCPCAGSENFFVAGPGIYFSGDTISAVDTSFTNELQYVDSLYVSGDSLYISLYLDSIPAIGVPLPTGSVSISAGTGISVTGTGTLIDPYLITNTSPHIGTDLSYTGTSSPITLNSSTGTDVTITAGTGISLAGTSSDLTISGTAAGLSKWTDAGAYTYLTATTDKAVVGSSTQIGSSYEFQSNGGVYSRGPIRADMNADSAGLVIRQNATQTNPLFRMEYSNGTFAGGANIYNSTNRSTVFGAVGSVHSSSPNNLVFGYSPNLVFAAGAGNNAYFTNSGGASNSGYENAYFGLSVGAANTSGHQNVGVGYLTLTNVTTGSSNMALGRHSMLACTTGGQNLALGSNTLKAATAPSAFNAIGESAAIAATTATTSTVIGQFAAGNKTTITGSIIIGQEVASTSGTGVSIVNQLWIDNSNTATPLISGDFSTDRVGVNTAHASLAQTFNVTGTARITGSDGTATTVMGRDGDGDISALSLSGMSISAGTLTATDGSTTNELQTLLNTSDATSHTVTLSNSGGSFQLVEGSGVTLTTTGTSGDGVVTIAATGAATDLTFSGASSPVTLNSSTGTDVTLTAGTGISLSASSSNTTITNSAPDQTVSITNGGGVSVSGTYPNFTLTATDASATNEAQTLSVSGTTSGILSLNAISGVGGGTATIAAGTGITVGQSGGTITITNSSPATAGWLLDGNTIGATKTIGSNDNFDVGVESNGITRIVVDNAGTVTIGATPLTTAQLSVNTLGSTNIGMLISGGSSLVGPNFYTATGSGSGSTATVLSGVLSMLNGDVIAKVENTSSTGTGGAYFQAVAHGSATGDPGLQMETTSTTWSTKIDNSVSGEPWKLAANANVGAVTPAISSTTANKVGVNEAAAVVTLQVTGTDAIGLPTGTTAQRSAAAIPQIRHNNTFSGLEFYDQNKNYWYRLTAVSTPTVTSNTAAGTGHSGNVLAGELSSDVRGVLELNTGSASLTTGTVMTVTYASAYSGTKTVVLLDSGNDIATTQRNRYRVDTQSNTGFTIKAVTALDPNETYIIKYYVGQ